MANIKPFLSILSTAPLLLTNLQVHADDEDVVQLMSTPFSQETEEPVETTLVKSPISFDFVGLQSDKYSASGGRFGFGYQPTEDSNLLMNVGIEYFSDLTYKLSDSEFESEFTNLRWSAGYKFDTESGFNVTPSLGVVTDLSRFNANTTQGFTNLRFAFDVTESFSLFMEATYDFGSTILPDGSNYGFGFKYTPFFKQPVVKSTNNDYVPEPLPVVEPIIEDTVEEKPVEAVVTGIEDTTLEAAVVADAAEVALTTDASEGDYQDKPYTVQLGAFRNMAAVNAFRQQNSISEDETFTREFNGLVKIYYKGFDGLSDARAALSNLKSNGTDGFVLNTPKEQASKPFVAMGSFYAVQLGSFSSLASADSIISKMQELDKQTFIKQAGELLKLYTGKFQDKSDADAELALLKASNVNGFVTKVN